MVLWKCSCTALQWLLGQGKDVNLESWNRRRRLERRGGSHDSTAQLRDFFNRMMRLTSKMRLSNRYARWARLSAIVRRQTNLDAHFSAFPILRYQTSCEQANFALHFSAFMGSVFNARWSTRFSHSTRSKW